MEVASKAHRDGGGEVAAKSTTAYTTIRMEKAPSGNQLLDPQAILSRVGIEPGMKVGDLGCGSGYFSFQAAKMVGNDGIVYSVDIQKNALSALKSKATFLGMKNLRPVWSNLEIVGAARRIANESLDIAFLVNVLHQSKGHANIFAEAHRLMKRSGILLVVDWKETRLSFAPSPEDIVKKEHAIRFAEQAGFVKTDEFDASKYHYALLFQK